MALVMDLLCQKGAYGGEKTQFQDDAVHYHNETLFSPNRSYIGIDIYQS